MNLLIDEGLLKEKDIFAFEEMILSKKDIDYASYSEWKNRK